MAGIFGNERAVGNAPVGSIDEWRLWALGILYPSMSSEITNGVLDQPDDTLRGKLEDEFRVSYQNHITSLRQETRALRSELSSHEDQRREGSRALIEMREIHSALSDAVALSAAEQLELLAVIRGKVRAMTPEEIRKRSPEFSRSFDRSPGPVHHGDFDLDQQLDRAEQMAFMEPPGASVPYGPTHPVLMAALPMIRQVFSDLATKDVRTVAQNILKDSSPEMVAMVLQATPIEQLMELLDHSPTVLVDDNSKRLLRELWEVLSELIPGKAT